MTTVQIIGVAVAALALFLVVIAFMMTRRRNDEPVKETPEEHGSFMEEAPHDTLARLGKAEQPVEDVTIDPVVDRGLSERAAEFAQRKRGPQPAGLGLEWFPDLSVRPTAVVDEPAPNDSETTGELWSPAVTRQPSLAAPQPNGDGDAAAGGEAVAAAQAEPCDCDPPVPEFHNPWEPKAEDPGALEAGPSEEPPGDESEESPADTSEAGGSEEAPVSSGSEEPPSGAEDDGTEDGESGAQMVRLSDVIVTTSDKMVDLQDPDVRRMLTELVTFEIDQATEYRHLGQTIDAVLQLTEAEKVSRALGMYESAQRIRAMMDELRG